MFLLFNICFIFSCSDELDYQETNVIRRPTGGGETRWRKREVGRVRNLEAGRRECETVCEKRDISKDFFIYCSTMIPGKIKGEKKQHNTTINQTIVKPKKTGPWIFTNI